MTHVLTMTQLSLAIASALALGAPAGAARAQANSDAGYVTDAGGSVTRSGYGLCWRAGSRPDARSISECEPKIVAPPIAMVVEPQPKAVEPTPPPVAAADVTPIAPPVVIERLTLDVDALFDFNRSVLRPAGRSALDDFAGRMKGIDPEVIMAVGHADRFGSDAYNQRLSELRANAVKTYLVSIGIASNRVHTEGKGETEPVTKTGQCDGARSAAVIACLQPDRRVEVEVMGNRITK
jgi:OOP family OmpA-OmpF porin